jgi:3-deoxy-D-manno-octulosonic-acid transferase
LTDGRPAGLKLYGFVSRALTPLAPALLRLRARHGREDPVRMRERLGFASREKPIGRVVWVHAASVGESLSVLSLLDKIGAERPEFSVLLTTTTRTAAEVLARRLPRNTIHQFAPIDTPSAVDRFLSHWRPELAVFVESELWPNLILEAKRRGAKLALVSARMSQQSFSGWRRAPTAIAHLFDAFDLVLARDNVTADRLGSLGARVDGVADLKFGASPLPCDSSSSETMRRGVGGRPVILGASTHAGEEALLLDRFMTCGFGSAPSALLILVPRHPDRGATIEADAKARGLSVARRSLGANFERANVYIADTVGELGLWYRLANLAFLGGSFAAGVGGHNPLEAARLGCPFVVGPHRESWPIYKELAAAGATACLQEPSDLDAYLEAAVHGSEGLSAMASQARAFVVGRDAETGASLSRVLSLLAP